MGPFLSCGDPLFAHPHDPPARALSVPVEPQGLGHIFSLGSTAIPERAVTPTTQNWAKVALTRPTGSWGPPPCVSRPRLPSQPSEGFSVSPSLPLGWLPLFLLGWVEDTHNILRRAVPSPGPPAFQNYLGVPTSRPQGQNLLS